MKITKEKEERLEDVRKEDVEPIKISLKQLIFGIMYFLLFIIIIIEVYRIAAGIDYIHFGQFYLSLK